MRFKFSNLGAIKETELDLRPLTVIIGPNNSNKTYLAYSVYGILEQIGPAPLSRLELTKESTDIFSQSIDKLADVLVEDCKVAATRFRMDLGTFFQDSSRCLFTDANFQFGITKQEVKDGLARFAKQSLRLSNGGVAKFSLKDAQLFVEFDLNNSLDNNKDMRDFQLSAIHRIKNALFPRVFLLPAERNGFILTYKIFDYGRGKLLLQGPNPLGPFVQDPNELAQPGVRRDYGSIAYPKPVEDFLDFLKTIDIFAEYEFSSKFSELADAIERHLQNNQRIKLSPLGLSGREIRLEIKKGFSIDLYNASSSIKQLASLLLYLRYRATENSLLIIDEPEMNLHPESQVKLLEALAILVNLGVKVLLTTHSPYIMDYLNVLISGNKQDEKVLKRQASSLHMKDARAFLSAEQVGAYEMREDEAGYFGLHDLTGDEDYGIRWDTLSDVSVDIQQKYFEIYEKGRASHGRKKKETVKGS